MARIVSQHKYFWWVVLFAALSLPGFFQASPAKDSQGTSGQIAYPGADGLPDAPIIEIANPVFGIRDRCLTCHRFAGNAALPDPRVSSTWEPYPGLDATAVAAADRWLAGGEHPGGWLNWHPPQEFGCTVCHGGKGMALDYAAAGHSGAGAAASRIYPMLSAAQMQARCGACHPGDYVPGAEDVWRGRILIRELNCAACHPVGLNLTGTHKGPSLARVGEKLTRNQVAAWPEHHSEWLADGRMPEFTTAEDLAWLIACYLVPEDGGPKYETDSRFIPSEEKLTEGLAGIKTARCANCHILPRPADADLSSDPLWQLPHGKLGPDLTHISARVDEGWVLEYLADPTAWYPKTKMPRYELTEAELVPLVVWLFETSRQQDNAKVLESHKHSEPAELAGLTDIQKYQRGKAAFVNLGCRGCHDSGDHVPWRTTAPDLKGVGQRSIDWLPELAEPITSLEEYFIRKVDDPGFLSGNSRMPRFDLNDEERRQIATALLAEINPPAPQYIKRLDAAWPRDWDSTADYAANYWPRMLTPQGAGPPALSRAERELHPESCATCHREQYLQWESSRHAMAMAPGVTGQLIDAIATNPSWYNSCMRCHGRLSSQKHVRPMLDAGGEPVRDASGKRQWEQNPHFQPQMYETANGCANCHVRAHERHGVEEPNAAYTWDSESLRGHGLQRSDYLAQSEYCKDCHQFDTDSMVEPGLAPRENTFVEWQEWMEVTDEPKSCQQCHMPDGDHSFKGIHDKDYVAENTTITSSYEQVDGVMSAQISLENTGGGHHLPTYITPKIFIRCYFGDANGETVKGSLMEETVGRGATTRKLSSGKTQWYDKFDTRIPAGDTYIYMYNEPTPDDAVTFHLEIFVAPDDFYHHLYEKWVGQDTRSNQGSELLGEALLETEPEVSGYYLLQQEVVIEF